MIAFSMKTTTMILSILIMIALASMPSQRELNVSRGTTLDDYLLRNIKSEHFRGIIKSEILKAQEKYSFPSPLLIARQIKQESMFKPRVTNKRTAPKKIAIGLMQIKPYYWGHHLYHMYPKLMKIYALKYTNGFQAQIEALKNPIVNIGVGTKAMHYYDQRYKPYGLALIGYYCGSASPQFISASRDNTKILEHKYVRKILYE